MGDDQQRVDDEVAPAVHRDEALGSAIQKTNFRPWSR